MKYTIDLDLYSCDCPMFPLIRFCKHISAVQRYFGRSGASASLFDSPSPAAEHPSPIPSSSLEPSPLDVLNSDAVPERIHDTVQKLERIAARLRENVSPCFSLVNLNTALNECLAVLGLLSDAGVLPVHQKVAPNVRTWNETKKVMPVVKTRQKRAGDQAYGAGAASGKKAKTTRRYVFRAF